MKTNAPVIIFTPDNEPYLGRTLLFHFDQIIIATMEQNALTSKKSHDVELTDHQKMACQVISQTISIALSMRELIRQGYLFGASVLDRTLTERAMIMLYLYHYPEDIIHWNNGWEHREAPSLAKMFDEILKKGVDAPKGSSYDLLKSLNGLIHGKPDSAYYNLITLDNSRIGFAPSKILDRPELCDNLCAGAIPMLAITQAMMTAYFQS